MTDILECELNIIGYMKMSIVSLYNKLFRMSIPSISVYRHLTTIFQTNNDGNILRVQNADKDFKFRLDTFDTNGTIYLQLKHFLTHIPDDSVFIIIPGWAEDIDEQCRLRDEVNNLNGKTDDLNERILEQLSTLLDLYHIRVYNGAGKSQYFGVSENRTCRFCGKSEPDVKFSSKAHAISECLGNKSLICNEECDDCNDIFSKTIEPDIAHMLSFLLTLHSIQGKRGLRKITGKNFKMSLDKSTATDNNIGTLKIQFDRDFPADFNNFIKNKLPIDTSNLKFTPQNVYKCLCKYVISILDNGVLPYFQDTIKWINNKTRYCKLPIVAIGNSATIHSEPILLVSIRKKDDYNYPYCFAILSIANIAFAFIVPFSSKDKYQFKADSKCYERFQDILRTYFNSLEWSFAKLSSSRKTQTSIDFSLNIPPECKLGRDYFIVNKSK